jgi:hypothetical protein
MDILENLKKHRLGGEAQFGHHQFYEQFQVSGKYVDLFVAFVYNACIPRRSFTESASHQVGRFQLMETIGYGTFGK